MLTTDIPNEYLLAKRLVRHVVKHKRSTCFLQHLLNAKTQQCQFVRRSQLDKTSNVADQITYVLGDSMGEMFTYYASCDIAFIGGSLLPLGGQNPIEAFSMGKPVLIGMHTFNFEQITNMAIVAGAALRVNDSSNLAQQLITLFADTEKRDAMASAALHFSKENQGATQRALMLIQQHLAS